MKKYLYTMTVTIEVEAENIVLAETIIREKLRPRVIGEGYFISKWRRFDKLKGSIRVLRSSMSRKLL